MNEEDIFPAFDPFGPLKDVAVIRDKHTGLHRGCAFVTFWAPADADRAQEALHDKFTFPGARRPAQVKPAEPSGEIVLEVGVVTLLSYPRAYHVVFVLSSARKQAFHRDAVTQGRGSRSTRAFRTVW
jgi:RNA recognition motif-containing protein